MVSDVIPAGAAGGLQARRAAVDRSADWLNSLRTTQGKEPGVAPVEAPLRRSLPEAARTNERLRILKQIPRRRLLGPMASLGCGPCGAPVGAGREKILTSPLVIGLVVSLAILVGMGFWLKSIISSTIASRTFDRAVQNFDDGDYRTAMRDFDSFLAANPQDKGGKARVLRSFANVRQYVTAEGGTWSSAMEAAGEMVEQIGAMPEFRDERVNLAELIIEIGEGLADRRAAGRRSESARRG